MNEITDTNLSGQIDIATTETNAVATSLMNCPFCDEQVSVNAKKCRHCGETIDVSMRKAEEALRASKHQAAPQVFMNAGGGAAAGGFNQLRPWGHGWHILLSLFTVGFWVPIWVLLYLFRNKSVYF